MMFRLSSGPWPFKVLKGLFNFEALFEIDTFVQKGRKDYKKEKKNIKLYCAFEYVRELNIHVH